MVSAKEWQLKMEEESLQVAEPKEDIS